MPDISMCNNHACQVAAKCYRHEAKPNPYMQAYMAFVPDGDKGCQDFILICHRDRAGNKP